MPSEAAGASRAVADRKPQGKRSSITMRALIQRVSQAAVQVDGRITGVIERGLVVLLGIHVDDTAGQAVTLAEKIAHLRIFGDDAGRFDRSVRDVGGACLVVSQFTLYADTRKGRRPSFVAAARPDTAEPLVAVFCETLRAQGLEVASGVFGAHMTVQLVNDGPVTIWLDTDDLARPRRSHQRSDQPTGLFNGPANS